MHFKDTIETCLRKSYMVVREPVRVVCVTAFFSFILFFWKDVDFVQYCIPPKLNLDICVHQLHFNVKNTERFFVFVYFSSKDIKANAYMATDTDIGTGTARRKSD